MSTDIRSAPARSRPTDRAEVLQVIVYGHSALFYWWPLWAAGLIMALVTWLHPFHVMIGSKLEMFHPSRNLGVIYSYTDDDDPHLRHCTALAATRSSDAGRSNNMKYLDRFRVPPGTTVKLEDFDTSFKNDHEGHKEAAKEIEHYRQRLRELQELLYADGRRSLLICLQALDAGGKDGTISHILGSMNPQGCKVVSFKQPSPEERAHDFLWRIHRAAPGRGEVTIFNRSHYEDVLIARVHDLVPKEIWSRRYDRINAFESGLVEDDTHILKFFLHISKGEQLKRFKDRLDDPAKQWKISEADYKERTYWDDYTAAYEDALSRCSTEQAPWFIIPCRPQVVPEPRRGPNRRGAPGRAKDDISAAHGGYRAHSQRVSHGEEAKSLNAMSSHLLLTFYEP